VFVRTIRPRFTQFEGSSGRTVSRPLALCLVVLVSFPQVFAQAPVGDVSQAFAPSAKPQFSPVSGETPNLSGGAGNMSMGPANSRGGGLGLGGFAAMCALGGAFLLGTPSRNDAAARWGDDLEIAARAPIEFPHRSPASGSGDGAGLVVGIDCDQQGQSNARITMGYNSDTRCSRDRMHAGMARHMDEHFLRCVQVAAEAAGMQKPERIHINHMGCYNVRTVAGSNTMSLHSHGRALDIGAIIFKPSGERVSMHVRNADGRNRNFYSALRVCWARSLPENCRTGGGREAFGSIGYPGSRGPGNDSHNDHLHLSFPPCAGG
jgi:hypothetical protein